MSAATSIGRGTLPSRSIRMSQQNKPMSRRQHNDLNVGFRPEDAIREVQELNCRAKWTRSIAISPQSAIQAGSMDVHTMADDLVAWLKRVAVPCPFGCNGDPLRILNDALSAADVVFLGEANHFVHEKTDFRLLFARHFVSRGWSGFMEEIGWSDGWRIGRYMVDGDPHWLARLSLFGHRGDSRTDRDDRPTGIFKASFDAYPHDLMRSEHERFYHGLSAAGDGQLGYFGVDIDGDPGGAYADIDVLTSPWAASTEVAAWRAKLDRVPGESINQEIRRVHRALPILPASMDTEARLAVIAAMHALTDSLEYVLRTYSASSYEATRPGMALREQAMKRRYAAARSTMGTSKPVLMGHALHLAKNDLLIDPIAAVGPGGGRVTSLGHHIVQELGKKAFSVWMIYGGGEDSQPLIDQSRIADFPADTLNVRLAAFNEPTLFLLDSVPAELLDAPVKIGQMYNSVFRTTLRRQVDALFYVPRVTPMKLD